MLFTNQWNWKQVHLQEEFRTTHSLSPCDNFSFLQTDTDDCQIECLSDKLMVWELPRAFSSWWCTTHWWKQCAELLFCKVFPCNLLTPASITPEAANCRACSASKWLWMLKASLTITKFVLVANIIQEKGKNKQNIVILTHLATS